MKKVVAVLFLIGAIAAVWDCLNPLTPDPDLLPVTVLAKTVVPHTHLLLLSSVALLPSEIGCGSRDVRHAIFDGNEYLPPGASPFRFQLLRI
jgi:hypothetical protein